MAPVTFYRGTPAPVQPYHISPWQSERIPSLPAPVLVPLRGDFFCLPFGGNTDEALGEKHPPHGETAGSPWNLASATSKGRVKTLTLAIETRNRLGRVTKELSIVDGENVVYSNHRIEGFAGRAPVGHHATLAMPRREGSMRIATSAIRFGMTCPALFSDPRQREYQSLLPGARWSDLAKVPAAWKNAPDADLTRFPARFGYADLVQIVNGPASGQTPAWTTATYGDEGYVWFALKNPNILNSTIFWIENHGRHGSPWNGRNNCLGLEDVTAFFADGLKASIGDNLLTREGVATAIELSASKPTEIRYIQGVVRIPEGFDCVLSLSFAPGLVTFTSITGKQVTAPVRHEFVNGGSLEP